MLGSKRMFYRVNFLYRTLTFNNVCTLHAADLEPWDNDGTPHLANVLAGVSELVTPFRAMLRTNWTLDGIDVQTVPDPNQPDQVPSASSLAVGLAGTRTTTDAHLPPRIGGMIKWRTSLVGRSFRGRMFCPPLEDTGSIVADLISSGSLYSIAMTAFANRVLDGNRIGPGADYGGVWDSEPLNWGVYSPTRHKLNLLSFTIINGFTVDNKLAYLSSRDR